MLLPLSLFDAVSHGRISKGLVVNQQLQSSNNSFPKEHKVLNQTCTWFVTNWAFVTGSMYFMLVSWMAFHQCLFFILRFLWRKAILLVMDVLCKVCACPSYCWTTAGRIIIEGEDPGGVCINWFCCKWRARQEGPAGKPADGVQHTRKYMDTWPKIDKEAFLWAVRETLSI